MEVTPPVSVKLVEVLEESKRFGFLGPGPVADHIDHASKFVAPLDDLAGFRLAPETAQSAPAPCSVDLAPDGLRFVDMGAGGGLPSLPVLTVRPEWSAVLLDASQKRCSFLVWAVGELGLADRVEVWCGRAEEIAHQDRARFQFDAVVARGFGPPASTVECGAPLLRLGGVLIISEPPGGRDWPAEPLAVVGMSTLARPPSPACDGDAEGAADTGWPGVVALKRMGDVESKFPRRAKIQQRTPLF